jgi:hypothetical protein
MNVFNCFCCWWWFCKTNPLWKATHKVIITANIVPKSVFIHFPFVSTQYNEFLSQNLPRRGDIMDIFMNAYLAWNFDTWKFMAEFSPALCSGTQCTYYSCRNTHWCHTTQYVLTVITSTLACWYTVAALVLEEVKPNWISLHMTTTHFSRFVLGWTCSCTGVGFSAPVII